MSTKDCGGDIIRINCDIMRRFSFISPAPMNSSTTHACSKRRLELLTGQSKHGLMKTDTHNRLSAILRHLCNSISLKGFINGTKEIVSTHSWNLSSELAISPFWSRKLYTGKETCCVMGWTRAFYTSIDTNIIFRAGKNRLWSSSQYESRTKHAQVAPGRWKPSLKKKVMLCYSNTIIRCV